MPKFRRKMAELEAFQMTLARRHSNSEWPQWLHEAWQKPSDQEGSLYPARRDPELLQLVLHTNEGPHLVTWDDWIVQDTDGQLHLYTPDEFAETYDIASAVPTQLEENLARESLPVQGQQVPTTMCFHDAMVLRSAAATVIALLLPDDNGTSLPKNRLEECALNLALYVQSVVHPDDDELISHTGLLRLGLQHNGDGDYNYQGVFFVCAAEEGEGWRVFSDEYAPELFDPCTLGDIRYLMRLADRRKK